MSGELAVRGLGMAFDGRWVLRDVDATFTAGAVHGLIGHNGSGKSTLIRILAGYHQPGAGDVLLDGRPFPLGTPARSHEAGLRFVHQDLGLIGEFTALENFGLGADYASSWTGLDWRRQRARFTEVMDVLQCEVPADRPVSQLSAVQRSLIAIGRAVATGLTGRAARFLVLDEPTTALEGPETEQLFAVIETLRASGVGVVYVSHHLDDVRQICADVTVLRDGRCVATLDTATSTHDDLVHAMLGDEWQDAAEPALEAGTVVEQERRAHRPAAIAVDGLRDDVLDGVSLQVAAGECVCVVGLAGSGREELLYALAGARSSSVRSLQVGGVETGGLDPRACRRHRVALVPGNRLPGSLVDDFTVAENLTLAALSDCTDASGRVRRRREAEIVARNIADFDIRPADPHQRTRFLSGGNKQKVVLAKWINTRPVVLLVDEPTAGVDVGAAHSILTTLRRLVDDGAALLVTTSEITDALAVADRVIVLNEGRVERTLHRATDGLTEDVIVSAMTRAGAPMTRTE